uniref:Secreted protein n=1 Tax=Panagrellus redivivus TaxID=6233 RepID=A0A7E4V4U6_PANRE
METLFVVSCTGCVFGRLQRSPPLPPGTPSSPPPNFCPSLTLQKHPWSLPSRLFSRYSRILSRLLTGHLSQRVQQHALLHTSRPSEARDHRTRSSRH